MTKYLSNVKLTLAMNIRLWILLVVVSCTSLVSAQGVLSGSQTGTVEEINQSGSILTIAGRNYNYDRDVTEVYYDGEKMRFQFLNEGLVVRFLVNRDGIISRIEVLGPVNLIEALDES